MLDHRPVFTCNSVFSSVVAQLVCLRCPPSATQVRTITLIGRHGAGPDLLFRSLSLSPIAFVNIERILSESNAWAIDPALLIFINGHPYTQSGAP